MRERAFNSGSACAVQQVGGGGCIQVGEAVAPACGSETRVELDAGARPEPNIEIGAGLDAGSRPVPNIESRAPTGALAVRLRYYRENTCSEEPTLDVPVQ